VHTRDSQPRAQSAPSQAQSSPAARFCGLDLLRHERPRLCDLARPDSEGLYVQESCFPPKSSTPDATSQFRPHRAFLQLSLHTLSERAKPPSSADTPDRHHWSAITALRSRNRGVPRDIREREFRVTNPLLSAGPRDRVPS